MSASVLLLSRQIDFGKIGSALWRGKGTILAATLAALALAVAVHRAGAARIYRGHANPHRPERFARGRQRYTQPAQVSDAALLQVESQVSVLTSDAVLRRVVASQGLDHDPEFVRATVVAQHLDRAGMSFPAARTLAALNELKRRVQVKRAERTFVVDVDVTSRDPNKAVRIANAIAQAYLDEQTQVRADAARQVSQSLSSRLKELKDGVREAEEKVEAFKARNNIVDRQRPACHRPAAHRDEQSARRGARPHRRGQGAARSGRSWCSAPRTRAAPSRRPCNRRPSPRCAANMPR